MSAVSEIRILTGELPLLRTFTTAVRSTRAIEVAIVELCDADGARGFGEATTNWRVTGESLPSVRAAIEGPLAEAVIGRDPEEILRSGSVGRALAFNSSAKSAIDCAIHDLLARRRGQTLADFLNSYYTPETTLAGSATAPGAAPALGGPALLSAPALTTDMTLSAGAPSEVLAAAESARGFATVKIKVSADPEHITSVAVLRDYLGHGVTLRVDANQAWTPEQAIDVIRGWEDAGLGLEFLEQPTPAKDLLGLVRVAEQVSTPIVADESVRDSQDAALLAHLAPGIGVNIKLAKTGGLAEAMALAEIAKHSGQRIMVGCMMESAVGITSAAALAAACSPGATHDLDAGLWAEQGPIDGGAIYDGERIYLSSGMGSGIHNVLESWVAA